MATPAENPSPTAQAVRDRLKGGMRPRSFRGRIITGLILIMPLALTAMIIRYVYNSALAIGVKLVYWSSWVLFRGFGVGTESPRAIDPANAAWYEITIAVVITVLMLYMLGWLGSNVVGRRLIEVFEALLGRIPLVDTIYSAIKRFIGSLSGVGDGPQKAQKVVLIEFPAPPLKAIGFVTGFTTDRNSGLRLATVYLPTAINPTSGYMEFVPVENLIETDLTPAQAMSIILSGGANSPPHMTLTRGGISLLPAARAAPSPVAADQP
jgi:uncharacterized membrane protein